MLPSAVILLSTCVLAAERSTLPSPYLVGQSWTPESSLVDSTQAARDISLLDLAQLPDLSSSLADWAAGNEICPIPDSVGAFRAGISPVQACHQFDMLLGPINVTHFAPLNRQTWRYYHHLAISRMADCTRMAPLIAPFYVQTDAQIYQVLHANQTETHECENEAMAYEMFAQHFLQDAWATGHMWKRWGQPNFKDFPADVSFGDLPSAIFPPEDERPRRAAIALLTAGISGTIHGAKPIIINFLRDKFGDSFSSPVLTDDPLSAPTYLAASGPARTQWLSPDNSTFSGAGDLFWDPKVHPQGTVNGSSDFVEQRTEMIKCGAASMLQAYNAGPQMHGAPTPNLLLSGVEPDSDECWTHWATNASMLGALGAVDFIYNPAAQFGAASLVNSLVNIKLANKTGLVEDNGVDSSLPNFPALLADAALIRVRLEARMSLDTAAVHLAYTENAFISPSGNSSARGLGPDGSRLSMLNSDPVADQPTPPPTDAPPPSPATSYADIPLARDATLESLPAPGTLGSAVSKLFWRGNLELTCRTSVANGSEELLSLQNQCINGAGGGGAPDACTACTELAEIHIPKVDTSVVPAVTTDSKCSALGVESASSAPAGLPSYWFDGNFRSQGGASHSEAGLLLPGFFVAMEWCTGTKLDVFDPQSPTQGTNPLRDSLISSTQLGQAVCPALVTGGFATTTWGTAHRRQAQALVERICRIVQQSQCSPSCRHSTTITRCNQLATHAPATTRSRMGASSATRKRSHRRFFRSSRKNRWNCWRMERSPRRGAASNSVFLIGIAAAVRPALCLALTSTTAKVERSSPQPASSSSRSTLS